MWGSEWERYRAGMDGAGEHVEYFPLYFVTERMEEMWDNLWNRIAKYDKI